MIRCSDCKECSNRHFVKRHFPANNEARKALGYNFCLDCSMINSKKGLSHLKWLQPATQSDYMMCAEFLCGLHSGLHEVYNHIMISPDLFLSFFISLFVYESRAPVMWSSVYGELVVLVASLGSSNFFQVIVSWVSSPLVWQSSMYHTEVLVHNLQVLVLMFCLRTAGPSFFAHPMPQFWQNKIISPFLTAAQRKHVQIQYMTL